MATFQITSMRQEVQTVDEGVHLAAGVSYWLTSDYRLNEEHPPLAKLLAALPVVLAKPNINFSSSAWQTRDQWQFAREFLYQSRNDADQLLFLGRLPMVFLALLLGLFIFLWAKRLGGDLAGFLALAWYALDPNFLAHGRYITTDVAVTLGFTASLYFLFSWLKNWRWQNALVFGLIFGITQVTKFSAVFLWIIILLIGVIWFWHQVSRNLLTIKKALVKIFQVLGIAFVGTFICVTLVYSGQIKSGKNDPWVQELYRERAILVNSPELSQKASLVQKLIKISDEKTFTGKAINYIVKDLPILNWSYFKGLAIVVNHDYWGHLAYLNGQYSEFGWWWYFPLAFLVKTPLATLVLFVVALIAFLWSWREKSNSKGHANFWILGLASIMYFLWSLTSHINLGQRHIFPIYPAIFVFLGIFLSVVVKNRNQVFKILIFAIAVLYLLTSLLAFPAYTAYFSELIGGEKNGHKYLVDSNVDWGQDLKRLRSYLIKNQIPFVCMSYFGQASLVYYGIDYRYLPTSQDPHDPNQVNCLVAISLTSYLSEDGAYWWLKKYQPDVRIGGSIYLYDFRNGRTPRIK
jgi:4-amino-4-deoxy-L-arabinose transferase-like glycosyltransferase